MLGPQQQAVVQHHVMSMPTGSGSAHRAEGSRKAAASEGGGIVGVPLAVRGRGAGSAASSRLSMSQMNASTCAAEDHMLSTIVTVHCGYKCIVDMTTRQHGTWLSTDILLCWSCTQSVEREQEDVCFDSSIYDSGKLSPVTASMHTNKPTAFASCRN